MSTIILKVKLIFYNISLQYPAEQTPRATLSTGMKITIFLYVKMLDSIWNVMAHGDAREGKWRGNQRMEWVASILHTPRNMVYPALLPLMRIPRLPVVETTDAPADLTL